jgi:hypothetical protein
MVLEAEGTNTDQDPVRMFGNDGTGVQMCGISELSQSALRGGVQCSSY